MTSSDASFEDLLAYLKQTRGFDFSAYKRSSLARRVQRRMQMLHIADFADYQDHLEVHPEEFRSLFNVILINVTSFFRDWPSWEYLAAEIVPRIIAARDRDEPIRLWSAGCASGEEAYSLAMLLAEALGIDAFKQRVKIYATDVDEEALSQGRAASYRARDIVQAIPPAFLSRYFEAQGDRFLFNRDLRRSVVFGRHDLIQDAPISRVHLLVCRNALMYFNAEAQTRVLERFHFALDDGGYIFLGKAEMLFSRQDMFRPVDLKRRIFTKVHRGTLPGAFLMAQGTKDDGEPPPGRVDANQLRSLAFDADSTAQISIDANGQILLANAKARAMFSLTSHDLGRPLRDLELSHRPFPVSALIDRANGHRTPVIEQECEWRSLSGDIQFFDVHVIPLTDNAGRPCGNNVLFKDVTKFRHLQDALKHTNQELETAYEEIQSTNEELETTNEELQSSNEELETTNEELQSTNEELETMNEELQSTNEELQAVNEELRQRGDELNQINGFLQSILSGLPDGVVVLDRELRVLAWNHKAEDLWGLRSDEVRGKHFLNLDIGLPVLELTQPIRRCLNDSAYEEQHLRATNRRGRSVLVVVSCAKLVGTQKDQVAGVILIMKEATEGIVTH